MSEPSDRIDAPTCRTDLIRKAAESNFRADFDWINDKAELLVSNNPSNRGFTGPEIRECAREWILRGGLIKCVPEKRILHEKRRHFHYDIIIENLVDFPRGLYVEMELSNQDEDEPAVNLLNAHPPSFV